MTREEIEAIVTTTMDAAFTVHRILGPGLLESVYQTCLASELRDLGIKVHCELALPVTYRNKKLDVRFQIDMLVEDHVIIENKAVLALHPVHSAQLLTYLRLSNLKLGLLINWNVPLLKQGFKRVVNNL